MTASGQPLALDDLWTDDDDRPFGGWVVIDREEWRAIIADAGGLEALTVYSSCTDPEGVYGRARVYTAWGRDDDGHPLVDVDDFYEGGYAERGGRVVETVFRKFVRTGGCS